MYYRNRVSKTSGKDCGHQQGMRVQEGHFSGYLQYIWGRVDARMPGDNCLFSWNTFYFTSRRKQSSIVKTGYDIFATIGLTRLYLRANVKCSIHEAIWSYCDRVTGCCFNGSETWPQRWKIGSVWSLLCLRPSSWDLVIYVNSLASCHF